MAFSIKNDRADALLRELTDLTGESLTAAVIASLQERLERERRRAGSSGDRLDAAVEHFRAVVGSARPDADHVLRYDADGLPS